MDDATWNPTIGCSVVSPGCTNCYAMKMAGRLEAMGQPAYQGHTTLTKAGFVWNGKVAASNRGQMIKPLSWRKPLRIFVNSMSDLFHEDMPEETIDDVAAVAASCRQHAFQILTKRASRMRAYSEAVLNESDRETTKRIARALERLGIPAPTAGFEWPLPNVWFGVSVEDQPRADERIPELLATPAAVRFLSCEPLLGLVDLRSLDIGNGIKLDALTGYHSTSLIRALQPDEDWRAGLVDLPILPVPTGNIDWVIVGGESGPNARPMHPDWARSLRDQCAAAGVPFFMKQMTKRAPIPNDLLIRQMPT